MRERVVEAVRERGLEVEVETLAESTRTVEDAARAVGCRPGQIAKSIVFVADGEPVVCVASGAHRVEPALVCEALDCAEARPATPGEVRAATGFSVGGVPPVGHDLPVLFDSALLEYEEVWAAGGDGHTVFSAGPAKLADCARAVVAPLASDGEPGRASPG
jgi:prolyl-tRNA editing enzyme YbaK/EbsC (Cys-tRNA(Pro) deacylase)